LTRGHIHKNVLSKYIGAYGYLYDGMGQVTKPLSP
jgi:hypothetical protein